MHWIYTGFRHIYCITLSFRCVYAQDTRHSSLVRWIYIDFRYIYCITLCLWYRARGSKLYMPLKNTIHTLYHEWLMFFFLTEDVMKLWKMYMLWRWRLMAGRGRNKWKQRCETYSTATKILLIPDANLLEEQINCWIGPCVRVLRGGEVIAGGHAPCGRACARHRRSGWPALGAGGWMSHSTRPIRFY